MSSILNSITIGKGKDLVFLHGWGGSKDSFRGVADFLCAEYRCTLIDLYGFGDSPAERALTLQDYADGVLQVMREKQISDAIVVGHSFGGRVATLMAAQQCDAIAAIVLVDAAGIKPRRGARYYFRRCKYLCSKACKRSLDNCGSPDYRALSPIMKRTFVNVVNHTLDAVAHSIRVPTLIVWGKRDKETPMYMARRLCRAIADSAIVTLDGGHFAYLQDAAKFRAVLRAFAEGIYGHR